MLAYERRRNGMESWRHLPFTLIKEFAYGDASLNEVQLHHCLNCEECSEIWTAFKREAQVIQRARALRAKTEEEMSRLLRKDPSDPGKKSA